MAVNEPCEGDGRSSEQIRCGIKHRHENTTKSNGHKHTAVSTIFPLIGFGVKKTMCLVNEFSIVSCH